MKGKAVHDTTTLTSPPPHLFGAVFQGSVLEGVWAYVFGAFYPDRHGKPTRQNWTFRKLLQPQDGMAMRCSITRNLPRIAGEIGVKEVLVPSPLDFNGRMCRQEDLTVRIPLQNGTVVRRGTRADGCLLQPGQAFGVSAAGCALIVARYSGDLQAGIPPRVAVAHAGLRSVIDYGRMVEGKDPRTPRGIVPALLEELGVPTEAFAEVNLRIILPISAEDYLHRYTHPSWGRRNKVLHAAIHERYGPAAAPGWGSTEEPLGKIDLAEIIAREAIDCGIDKKNIGATVSTGSFRQQNGEELVYTTRGQFKKHRNLMLIVRYS